MRRMVLLALLAGCPTASAGDLFGGLHHVHAQVSDPAGSVPGEGEGLGWQLGWEEKWGFDRRWYGDVAGASVPGITGSETTVGQSVSTWGVELGVRWHLRLTRHFQPGVALAVRWVQSQHGSRHLTDAEGFLATRLPDRKVSGIELVAGISQELYRSGPWGLRVGLETALPAPGGFWWAAGIGSTYRWEGF